MFNTWFILTETQGKQVCVLGVVHEPSLEHRVRVQFILEVGGIVNIFLILQVLIYPGKP